MLQSMDQTFGQPSGWSARTFLYLLDKPHMEAYHVQENVCGGVGLHLKHSFTNHILHHFSAREKIEAIIARCFLVGDSAPLVDMYAVLHRWQIGQGFKESGSPLIPPEFHTPPPSPPKPCLRFSPHLLISPCVIAEQSSMDPSISQPSIIAAG